MCITNHSKFKELIFIHIQFILFHYIMRKLGLIRFGVMSSKDFPAGCFVCYGDNVQLYRKQRIHVSRFRNIGLEPTCPGKIFKKILIIAWCEHSPKFSAS